MWKDLEKRIKTMFDAEKKLLDLGINKEDVALYNRIILLSKSWESLRHLMNRGKREETPYQFLAPIISQLYTEPLYNQRLKRITLVLRIPEDVKESYFKQYADQPEAFHRSNRNIPLAKRNKFIKASDKAVLNVIKDHLGYGPQYVLRNRISDAFENP